MSKTPFGEEAFCLQSADGLTYIKIGPHQNIVGMMHLEEVFQPVSYTHLTLPTILLV